MANSVPKMDWREHGVKIIRADQLDSNTPQTLGMNRAREPFLRLKRMRSRRITEFHYSLSLLM